MSRHGAARAPSRSLRRGAAAAAAALALAALPASAPGQSLADFDYENLELRGVGLHAGGIVPNTVEPEATFGASLDLGYLGPGLRIVPSVTWWSSRLDAEEVGELERKLEETIPAVDPGVPPPDISLGVIDWRDLAFTVDAQIVWRTPLRILTYVGLGGGAHFLDGSGEVIDDTFVEDLLDRVSPAVNAHVGAEYLAGRRFRVFATARYTVLEDVRYAEFGGGLRLMFGGPAPGEVP